MVSAPITRIQTESVKSLPHLRIKILVRIISHSTNSPSLNDAFNSAAGGATDDAATSTTRELAPNIPQLRLGLATDTILQKYGLHAGIRDDILWNLKYISHVDWYWRLIDDSGLDENATCELTIAIHLDTGVPFDYGICTLTPYSPWSIY